MGKREDIYGSFKAWALDRTSCTTSYIRKPKCGQLRPEIRRESLGNCTAVQCLRGSGFRVQCREFTGLHKKGRLVVGQFLEHTYNPLRLMKYGLGYIRMRSPYIAYSIYLRGTEAGRLRVCLRPLLRTASET